MKTGKIRMTAAVTFAMLALAEAAPAYYNPAIGRFLSRDPINEPGANLVRATAPSTPAIGSVRFLPKDGTGTKIDTDYGFVQNAPTITIDPDGRCPIAQAGEVRWGVIVMRPGPRYFRSGYAWLEAAMVVNGGMVNPRFFNNPCCPAIGVIQIAREKYDNGGFGAWALDKAKSSTPPFYGFSFPLPPAKSTMFGFTDNPGWNPPGDYDNNTFAQEFKTCVFCASNSGGKWKAGCSLSCINWGYTYSLNSAGPPDHMISMWVRGASLVSGPPTENPPGPTLAVDSYTTTRSDSDVEAIVAPYR